MLTDRYFFLDQHGCAKNQIDGEILATRLEKLGLKKTDNPEDADIILVNSCGFIEQAKTESISSVMNYRSAFPEKKIIFSGCLAERYAEIFSEQLSECDAIFGNGDLSKIDDVIKLLGKKRSSSKVPFIKPEQKGVCEGERRELLNFPGSAYVKITEGCDNCCTFCAIPLIRGRLRSRKSSRIIEEIKDLVSKKKIFEINLIGQDLAAYGCEENFCFDDGTAFSTYHYNGKKSKDALKSPLRILLEKILSLQGDFVIRLLYIHPDHFPLDLLELVETNPKILPYFDIPFQCGDDKQILAMNRHGTVNNYIRLINQIRNSGKKSFYKTSALRTTFMTGFPGETETGFENTVNFLGSIKPDWSGCFTYSKEDDTKAALMKNQIPKKKAKERAKTLQKKQEQLTSESLKQHIGKIYRVLIEEVIPASQEEGGIAIGRSWFQAPEVDGATVVSFNLDSEKEKTLVKPGNIVYVQITGSSDVDISGFLVLK
jgi:ribosomal protein S12 methylthiotransferase